MSQQGRRLLVCVVWMAVGVMLIVRALPYLGFTSSDAATRDFHPLEGPHVWMALGAALLVGVLKGFTVMRKAARRSARGIVRKGETAPFWSVFSVGLIVLVVLMIVGGLAIRKAPYDPDVKGWVVGVLYPGIGLALLIGGLLALSVEPLPD